MNEEEELKLVTQATACLTSFIRGLINEEMDISVMVANNMLIKPYAEQLVNSISTVLQKSINKMYQPLQQEVLVTLSCLASVLDTAFASYYDKFIPGLKKILKSVEGKTQQEQELRSSCIETFGFILMSVKN